MSLDVQNTTASKADNTKHKYFANWAGLAGIPRNTKKLPTIQELLILNSLSEVKFTHTPTPA